MFSSHRRKVPPLLGTRGVELAILVLLVINAFGLGNPSEHNQGLRSRETLWGHYPGEAPIEGLQTFSSSHAGLAVYCYQSEFSPPR